MNTIESQGFFLSYHDVLRVDKEMGPSSLLRRLFLDKRDWGG